MSGPRIGELCAGYAGISMAVEQVLGGELAWVADNDPGAAAILAHRFPAVKNLGDITTVDWSAAEPVDILTGGYPCQPASDAGLRKGTDDERWIWPHFIPAIRVLRPRLIVLENVRGHLGRGFDAVLGDLAALGFDAEWVTMPASGVGACHARQRIFVIAWPTAVAESVGRGMGGRQGRQGSQGQQCGMGIAERSTRTPEDPDRTTGGERRVAAAGEAEGGRPWADLGRPSGTRAIADTLGAGLEIRGVEHHGPQRPAAERGGAELPAADTKGDGRVEGWPEPARLLRGSHAPLGDSAAPEWAADEFWRTPGAFGLYEAAVRQHEQSFGRRAPAPVEPGRNGKPRLAARFPEWMMGLPDGWVTAVPGLSRNDQLHAIGNGVVPAQGEAAIRLLLERAPEAMWSMLARTGTEKAA